MNWNTFVELIKHILPSVDENLFASIASEGEFHKLTVSIFGHKENTLVIIVSCLSYYNVSIVILYQTLIAYFDKQLLRVWNIIGFEGLMDIIFYLLVFI